MGCVMERQIDDAMVEKIIALQDAVWASGTGQPRYEAQVNFDTYAEEFAYELALDLRALRAAVRSLKPPIGVAEIWGNAECVYCIGDDDRGNVTHAPDCPWAVARALAGEEVGE